MKLTYKFKNDETSIEIEKKEYLNPIDVTIYTRNDDEIYVYDKDNVYINQLIKTSKNGIKTYAPISGIAQVKQGIIKIINDNSDSMIVSENTREDINTLKMAEILNICDELGIEYENKLLGEKLKQNSKLLVVNAMDIEPYQFNNNYFLEDKIKEVLETAELLSNALNINAYLLLNKYDENNIEAVRKIISKYPDIIFKTIDEEFPFTTNQCLTKKYFKEYKYDDILFFDPFALNKIYVALKDGLPVNDRYITICINGTEKVYVIKCKYNTNLSTILDKAVSIDLTNKDVYLNNYMRRIKCENVNALVVNDNVKTIFIFDHEDVQTTKCIKCGKCVDVCPVNINPLAKKIDPSCIRCGLCNNICPANINLLSKEK